MWQPLLIFFCSLSNLMTFKSSWLAKIYWSTSLVLTKRQKLLLNHIFIHFRFWWWLCVAVVLWCESNNNDLQQYFSLKLPLSACTGPASLPSPNINIFQCHCHFITIKFGQSSSNTNILRKLPQRRFWNKQELLSMAWSFYRCWIWLAIS